MAELLFTTMQNWNSRMVNERYVFLYPKMFDIVDNKVCDFSLAFEYKYGAVDYSYESDRYIGFEYDSTGGGRIYLFSGYIDDCFHVDNLQYAGLVTLRTVYIDLINNIMIIEKGVHEIDPETLDKTFIGAINEPYPPITDMVFVPETNKYVFTNNESNKIKIIDADNPLETPTSITAYGGSYNGFHNLIYIPNSSLVLHFANHPYASSYSVINLVDTEEESIVHHINKPLSTFITSYYIYRYKNFADVYFLLYRASSYLNGYEYAYIYRVTVDIANKTIGTPELLYTIDESGSSGTYVTNNFKLRNSGLVYYGYSKNFFPFGRSMIAISKPFGSYTYGERNAFYLLSDEAKSDVAIDGLGLDVGVSTRQSLKSLFHRRANT